MSTPQSERNHKHVERLKEDSLEILSDKNVIRRLGSGAISHLEQAVEHSVAATPNENGFLDFPRNSPENIPVAIVRSIGQRVLLHANDSLMTPQQARHMEKRYSASVAERNRSLFNGTVVKNQKHVPLFIAGSLDHTASGKASANEITINDQVHLFGRPFIELNAHYWELSERLSPLVYMHELEHAIQRRREPIVAVSTYDSDEYRVRRELEAFYAVAQMILGLKESGKESLLPYVIKPKHQEGILSIDAIRDVHQPTGEQFAVSPQLIEDLRDKGLHRPAGLRD